MNPAELRPVQERRRRAGLLRRRTSRGEFGRNVLLLVSGTALSQAITMAAAPILSRMYSPAEFGDLAVFTAITTLVLSVSSLRYELAVPLPRHGDAATNTLTLAIAINVVVALVAGVAMFAFGSAIAEWTGLQALTALRVAVPIFLLVAGTAEALNFWAIRTKSYREMARASLGQGFSQSAANISLGAGSVGSGGLLIGGVVGRSFGLTVLALGLRNRMIPWRAVSWDGIRQTARRYRRFAVLSAPIGLMSAGGLQLPNLLIASLFGVSVAGTYLLAQRVVGMPLTLLGNAISNVYVGEASRLVREQDSGLHHLFVRTVRHLTVLGLFPFLVLVVTGPTLFDVVFGDEWRRAGEVAQLVAPMFLMQFITSPVSQTLTVLEQQGIQLAFNIVRMVLAIGVLVGSDVAGLSAMTTLGVFSATTSFAYGTYLWLSYRGVRSGVYPRRPAPASDEQLLTFDELTASEGS